MILDGWGLAPDGPGNAVAQARTPNFDALWERHVHGTLTACGRAVGLPEGQMGNSEVGHLNLGAGQVVRQDLTRIDDAIDDKSFAKNKVLRAACAAGRTAGRLHLLGLVSDGGVHSSMGHLLALIRMAARERVPDILLHAFTDGRDTSPTSGANAIAQAEIWLANVDGRIATITGRYYAMDRDSRWERTKVAYDAIVNGKGETPPVARASAAVTAAYEAGQTDEFLTPLVGGQDARIREGDSVIFFNFRPDRVRQRMLALGQPDFGEFDRGDAGAFQITTLTEYREDWEYPVAFPPERPETTLARVLSRQGVRQLHAAETEKYPHVTYFFNGGEEGAYPGEERRLVDSPRDVPTYDQRPEMSAAPVAEAFVEDWSAGTFGFGIINFANADMVGHSGVIEAAVAAVEAVDRCLGRVVAAVHQGGGACV
ncbi:MAG TPA: 2,3-bisphosphoglycerate-independent phosphoglycerate mutase, partial [Solirubrobacteraceae bacterium]|nr:2,3-bisphosphoglycerate-independent phosphoglycerate mutase [Solirubrobacteraceae bacterium]